MNWVAVASFLIGGLLVVALAPYALTTSQRWGRVVGAVGGSALVGVIVPLNWEATLVVAAIGLPLLMPLAVDYAARGIDRLRLMRDPLRRETLRQARVNGYCPTDVEQDVEQARRHTGLTNTYQYCPTDVEQADG